MDVSKLISELLSEREDVERAIFRLERFARLSFGAANAEPLPVTEIGKNSTPKEYRRNRPAAVRARAQPISCQSRSNFAS